MLNIWLAHFVVTVFAATSEFHSCPKYFTQLKSIHESFESNPARKAGLIRVREKGRELYEKSIEKQRELQAKQQHKMVLDELKDMYGVSESDYEAAKNELATLKPNLKHGLETLAKQLAIARAEKKAMELIKLLMKTETYFKRSVERIKSDLDRDKELSDTLSYEFPEESKALETYQFYINALVALRKNGFEFQANQIAERLKNQLPPSQ